MSKFIDKCGRQIEIEISGDSVHARHEGNAIGNVHTIGPIEVDHGVPGLPAQITGWNVDAKYRKTGIATEMVRQLVEELGVLAPAKRDIGIGGVNALTDEGLALTVHCQKLDLIYPFADEEEHDGDDSIEFLE